MPYTFDNDKVKFENGEEELRIPTSFAGLIVGKRKSGKTHLLFKLLLEDYVDYNRLYIFSPSIYQSEYQLLIEGFKQHLQPYMIFILFNSKHPSELKDPKDVVKGMVDDYNKADPTGSWKSTIEVFPFKDINAIPRPEEVDKKFKNLFIFDDCMTERNQEPIYSYYTRGRHSSVQCFYISQNYHALDKRTIRDNSSLIILFKIPKINWWHIYNDHFSTDIEEFSTFKRFAARVWDKPYEFMVIDTDNEDMNWKFRKGFDIPYNEVMQ